jgi:threonine aldolase
VNARRLAEGLAGVPGLAVELAAVETNMVNVDHRGLGWSTDEVLARLAAGGVIASGRPPHHLRLVTNRHHDAGTIDEAVERVRTSLAEAAQASHRMGRAGG